ncbi:hypothetical protein [Rhizobacter sp. Root1221]|uniref:hypothetical protein n=1 Tax=Rhizobacter sp. Root1221 TaxID=1736433 RepID=UPI0006FCBDEA|nr:hypothetical protein [Rhizobacter sp. Root1221]KQW02639.1 hypothetical protein ASC87_13110 [Rhizobacter sp. Root1221]
MTASKTLTAIAAAAALIGTIGYATAQSTTNDGMSQSPAVTPADTTTTTPAQPVDSTTSTMPADTAPAATVDSERSPQADRN